VCECFVDSSCLIFNLIFICVNILTVNYMYITSISIMFIHFTCVECCVSDTRGCRAINN